MASASLRHTPLALNLLSTSISGSFWTSPPWCPIFSSSPACSPSVCMSPSSCPGGSDSKESSCSEGDLGLIPGLGRSPGGGHGNPLQYSCLGNPHGQRSLAGYSSWGRKQLDTNERLNTYTSSCGLFLHFWDHHSPDCLIQKPAILRSLMTSHPPYSITCLAGQKSPLMLPCGIS